MAAADPDTNVELSTAALDGWNSRYGPEVVRDRMDLVFRLTTDRPTAERGNRTGSQRHPDAGAGTEH